MILNSVIGVLALIAVMVVLVVGLTVAFILFGKRRAKSIKNGSDDKDLSLVLEKRYNKYVSKNPDCTSFAQFMGAEQTRRKKLNIVSNVFYVIIIVLSVAIGACAVFFRTQSGQFFIGNTAYVTILTGSMAESNPQNPYYAYLQANPQVENDMGQIPAHTLVGIKKGDGNYKLYDIVAFVENGVTYLHRIIAISDDGQYYTTMGDTNKDSNSFEKNMPASKIIGIYNGQKSHFLGEVLIFCKSDVGIVTLVAIIAFLFALSIASSYVSVAEKERMEYLAAERDKDKQPQSE